MNRINQKITPREWILEGAVLHAAAKMERDALVAIEAIIESSRYAPEGSLALAAWKLWEGLDMDSARAIVRAAQRQINARRKRDASFGLNW